MTTSKRTPNALVFNASPHYINTLFYDVGAIPKNVSDYFDKDDNLVYLLMPYDGCLFIVERSTFKKTKLTTSGKLEYDTFVDNWLSVYEADDLGEEAAMLLASIVTAAANRNFSWIHFDSSSDLLLEAETLTTNKGVVDESSDDIDDEPVLAIPGPGPGEDAETENINRLISDHLLQIKALMAMRDELEPSSIEAVYVIVSADGVDYTHEL